MVIKWLAKPEQRRSIPQRAAILARIRTGGERALVPIDPDRLATTERRDNVDSFVPKLPQAFDDCGRYSVLKLIDALVVQAARHIDGFLNVAAIVENIGEHMHLADRLILPAHHAK